jgi:hypothetical protein
VAGHAGLACAGGDLAGDLALQGGRVESAFADDDRARGAHAGVEVQRLQDERGARLQLGAVAGPQPAGQPAGRSGHRDPARVLRQRRRLMLKASLELLDGLGIGAFLRTEARGGELKRRAHVAQDDQRGAL